MATIRQLKQGINALFLPPSLITTTRLYVRPSGSTWTTFNRPGPISNDFLPGKFVIPCASLKQEAILRVIPYSLSCSGDNKKDDSYEGDNKSDEETKTYQFYEEHGTSDSTSSNSDSSLMTHQRSYIRPEYGESSAKSAARQDIYRQLHTL